MKPCKTIKGDFGSIPVRVPDTNGRPITRTCQVIERQDCCGVLPTAVRVDGLYLGVVFNPSKTTFDLLQPERYVTGPDGTLHLRPKRRHPHMIRRP